MSLHDVAVLVGSVGMLFLAGVALGAAAARGESETRQQQPGFRTWTDITGKFTTEAAFLDFREGKVRLKKKDESVISVEIKKLSQTDQAFVKLQLGQGPKRADEKGASDVAAKRPPIARAAPPKQRKAKTKKPPADREQQIVKLLYLPVPGLAPKDSNEIPRCKAVRAKTIEQRFGTPDDIYPAQGVPLRDGPTLVRWKFGNYTLQEPIAGRTVRKVTEGWEVRAYGKLQLVVDERGVVIGMKTNVFQRHDDKAK